MNKKEEQILRESIRQAIKIVKQKKLNEEQKFRGMIRSLIDVELNALNESGQVPDDSPTPNESTGINVLEDLLKNIISTLEDDYRLMTTAPEQRKSYRAHILNAIVNVLTPAEVNTEAGKDQSPDLEEDLEIEIEDEDDTLAGDEEKFIDIRTDAERAAEDGEQELSPEEEFGKGMEGADKTGRNIAYTSFKKVQSKIIDSYELLSNPEDQEKFFDYLIANVKMYFDKFEDEMDPTLEEPTNQAYQAAKSEAESEVSGISEEIYLEL